METLKDPLNDRQIKSVKIPPAKPLQSEKMYPDPSNPSIPDLALIRQWLLDEGSISKADLVKLVKDTTKILKSEPNILRMNEPVIIVGDIHGQYYDLIHMFEKVVD